MKNINNMIDHTNLKQDVTSKDIDKLIEEARKYGFHSICINPSWIAYARKRLNDLKETNLKICTVIGFYLGQNATATKIFEAKQAILDGVDELDFVVNVSFIKEKNLTALDNELHQMREVTKGYAIKLIIESSLLTDEEKELITKLVVKHNFDFVKTATGLSKGGATIEDVKLLRSIVGPNLGVKASGGIKTYEDALKMIEAGANRIGTSNGLAIVQGIQGKELY